MRRCAKRVGNDGVTVIIACGELFANNLGFDG